MDKIDCGVFAIEDDLGDEFDCLTIAIERSISGLHCILCCGYGGFWGPAVDNSVLARVFWNMFTLVT